MRYLIIFSLLFSFSCSDKNYPNSADKECVEYFKLIKKDWRQNKEGIFYFKSLNDYDEIFETNRFYNKACILFLSVKEVKFLFGEPSEIFKNDKGWVYSYDMGPVSNITENARLSISFDEIRKEVKDIYFGPSAIEGEKMKRREKKK